MFHFCYERDFIKSLSRENQADIIEAFNSTSRYFDDLLNIDNIYFYQMVDRIYLTELQLNRANSSDTEAPFLDLNLCISNGTVSTKIYDKGTILILILSTEPLDIHRFESKEGASVSEDFVLFNWSSVGYIRSTIW